MRKTKTILVLAMVVLVLACAVGGTIAFLIDTTGAVTNTFTPAKVTCAVVEGDFSPGVSTTKNNVKIQNTGTTDAWIRATVVANWVKDNMVVAPWTDDIPTYNTGTGEKLWTYGDDGYYYYNSIVSSGETTENLFASYTPTGGPEGAHLEMTIVCQAVQSNLGTTAQAAFTAAASKPSGT
ncbi:MAG: hypothetical protein ACI4O8_08630 [Aristaeellaceae bacterium]